MRDKIYAVVVFAVALFMLAISTQAAGAFPAGEVPHFAIENGECILYIDPPFQIPVTFTGSIGANVLDRTGGYAATEPHKAKITVTDLFDVGKQHVIVTATAPFLGTSPTVEFDAVCKPTPTTTTTAASTTTTVVPTPTTSTTAAQPTTTTTKTVGTPVPHVNLTELPHTGSNNPGLEFAVGGSLLVVGAPLVRRFRKRGR